MIRAAACVAAGLVILAAPVRAQTVAVLQELDKTTARATKFDAPIDQAVRFGTLIITVKACDKRPPEEPPETAAFLIIDRQRPGNAAPSAPIFSGWMFASSSAVSALEDPIYDVSVLDCKTDATAAPPKDSTGK